MRAGWTVKALGDVCNIIGGGTPAKSNTAFYEGDIPWATVRDMKTEILKKTDYCISQEAVKSSSTNIIPAHNVVIATRVGLGKVCLLEQDTAINQDLRGVTPKFPGLDVHYLFRWLQSISHKIEAEGTGATVKGVKLPFIKSLQIPMASISEQKRIVSILDEAFAGIERAVANTEKNFANARELFESFLDFEFSQKNKEWQQIRLGDISERVSVGHVGPTSKFYCDSSNGVPFLRSQNVRPGKIDWSGIRFVEKGFHERLKKSQLKRGDLLFVRVGANRGDCCAIKDDVGDLNCANIVFARPSKGNVKYMELYCQSPLGRKQLLGMTTGSAQGVINTSSVANLLLPLPPSSFQKNIVDKIYNLHRRVDELKSVCQQKLKALSELKQSLLQKAFSGELTAEKAENEMQRAVA